MLDVRQECFYLNQNTRLYIYTTSFGLQGRMYAMKHNVTCTDVATSLDSKQKQARIFSKARAWSIQISTTKQISWYGKANMQYHIMLYSSKKEYATTNINKVLYYRAIHYVIWITSNHICNTNVTKGQNVWVT